VDTPGLFSLDVITGGGCKKIADRYYQVEAVQAISAGLRNGGRGQLRSACGTGKTVMCQRSAELLCSRGGVVVIVCPSVDLVAQTLREWDVTNQDHVALAVCGDESVVDSVTKSDDLPCAVTTDAAEVVAWLRVPSAATLRLIVGTHRSAHVVGEGLQQAGSSAELLVVDEAHRAAGQVDKHTALVHDDAKLPAKRRLYATATPRVIGDRPRRGSRTGRKRSPSFDKVMIGMDDESIFGPVLYNYPFSTAIDDGFLDDYRLVVMGVTRREIHEHLSGLPRGAAAGNSTTSLHTAMVQTVLAKAAAQYGMRRVLTFCSRLNEASDFARSMKRTISNLPRAMRPDRPLTTAYVHGGLSTVEREKRLAQLITPPDDGWTVVANVRCLTEGVDVPAIDGVVFTHPKQSINEIVQAIGRALRRDPNGTGVATILVPILLPDDPGDLDEVDVADYRLLWQVVRALRAHDTKLGSDIDRLERPHVGPRYYYDEQPLEQVLVELPPGYDNGQFLHHLTAKIISSARSPWWDGYAALKEFHAEYGHANVHSNYITTGPEEYKLGAWAERTRTLHRQGRLATDRIEALEELGFDFLPRAVEWAAGLRAAARFYAEHGHLEPVRSLRVDGVDLLAWLERQRAAADTGNLAESRRVQLDSLKMRWSPPLSTFDDYLRALTDYHRRHGHIAILPNPDTADGRLGSWLVNVRIDRKLKKLDAAQIAALDELGMRWSPNTVPAAVFQSASG
jgi:superfamily II DNA or RNA helicase